MSKGKDRPGGDNNTSKGNKSNSPPPQRPEVKISSYGADRKNIKDR
jgi:hypothetical protein